MMPLREKEVVAVDPRAQFEVKPIRIEQIASELYEAYSADETFHGKTWKEVSTTEDAERFREQAKMLCSKFWLNFISDAIEGYGIRGAKTRVSGDTQKIFKKNN